MKRKGYIYDRMTDWDMLVMAEKVAVNGKAKNKGVRMHREQWMKNRVEIHDMVVNHRMQTSDYKFDNKVSGQGKMRKIAKLHFHPSHIQHQLLVMAPYEDIDRSFIHHTYASRNGYGQHRGALQMNKWIQARHKESPIYLQIDVVKYYENIPHSLLRVELERRFKDRAFVDAMLEPVERFSPSGIGIPLGIRPSQTFGNLALSSLDRYIKEQLRVRFYMRYLDDMVLLCRNKGEAHRMAEQVEDFVKGIGFKVHVPKIRSLEAGLDFLGYVTYPDRGMFWRTSNKKAWLRRRKHISNPRRLREIDASAWGFLQHGNKHCKKLYRKMNGVSFSQLGLKRTEQTDSEGKRIIDAQQISMHAVLGRSVIVKDIVPGIKTAHGDGRMALLVEVFGQDQKLIVNAQPIKSHMEQMMRLGVTMHETAFVDRGGRRYDVDLERTNILEVNHRPIGIDEKGQSIFLDTREQVSFT